MWYRDRAMGKLGPLFRIRAPSGREVLLRRIEPPRLEPFRPLARQAASAAETMRRIHAGELVLGQPMPCVVCGCRLSPARAYVCHVCEWAYGGVPLGRSAARVSFARIDEINAMARPRR